MRQIKVIFSKKNANIENPDEQIEIFWLLKNKSISQRYFKALQIACLTKQLYRCDRFSNFKNTYYTDQRIVEKLNRTIAIINAQYPNLIKDQAYLGMSQEYMNHIHTYFETHRGPLDNSAALYSEATSEIKEAFDEFNILIHKYEEHVLRNQSTYHYPFVHFNFGLNEIVKRYRLESADFEEFSFSCNFGDWLISYCEVGKPLHDVWHDQDINIGSAAVIPLKYYSADGMVHFGKTISQDMAEYRLKSFYQWWDQNEKKLNELGFVKFDKKNSIGNIVVAEMNRSAGAIKNLDEAEIVELLSNYQWIQSVQCDEVL